jgi:hypothetical protein
MFKEEMMSTPHEFFQKTEEEVTVLNSFYEPGFNPIIKPVKSIERKEIIHQ